jgi:hypothetical protein
MARSRNAHAGARVAPDRRKAPQSGARTITVGRARLRAVAIAGAARQRRADQAARTRRRVAARDVPRAGAARAGRLVVVLASAHGASAGPAAGVVVAPAPHVVLAAVRVLSRAAVVDPRAAGRHRRVRFAVASRAAQPTDERLRAARRAAARGRKRDVGEACEEQRLKMVTMDHRYCGTTSSARPGPSFPTGVVVPAALIAQLPVIEAKASPCVAGNGEGPMSAAQKLETMSV